MADDKLNTGPGGKKIPEAPESVTAGQPQAPAPEQAAAPTPQQEQAGPAKPDPGDVVVSFEQINELMGEKRKAAQAEVEKAGDAPAKEAPGEPLANRKSPAVAVPRRRIKRSPLARRRQSPARAARPRLTRRPPARPSRPSETKCPEVTGKPRTPKLPQRLGKRLPKRRPPPRSRLRLGQPPLPVRWRKASSCI